LATLATERTNGLLADGDSAAAALNGGYHLAYLVGAALVLVAIAVAVVVLEPVREATMNRELAGAEPAGSEAA
jgi:hypothetical protein